MIIMPDVIPTMESNYVSCIKIGKQPIIPPLLTEDGRNEMRYYRELAVLLEKRRKNRRNSNDSGVMISSNDGSCPKKVDLPEGIAKESSLKHDSSNDVLICDDASSVESDHDNVFIDADENFYPLQERRNSGSTECSLNTVEEDKEKQCDVRRRGSYTIENACDTTSEAYKKLVAERRNSYTLECPSPVMLQYMQSLQRVNPNEPCELFVEHTNNYDAADVIVTEENNLDCEVGGKELTLEDLLTDSTKCHDLRSSGPNLCDACSNETLHTFLENDFTEAASPSSSVSPSTVSVLPDYNSTNCLKSNAESTDVLNKSSEKSFTALPVINRSYECICNAISKFEPLRRSRFENTSPNKNYSHNHINDSFDQDFRYLDFNDVSLEDSDTCPEGRYSVCSSVSLSKFLSGDKLPEGMEAEYAAFAYMKEQLEMKHRNEFKRLLSEQQKEHDNLKTQFNRMSSLAKHTPSPKSNYAYSRGVVLKKYSPSSGQCTPVTSKSLDERYLKSGECTPKNCSEPEEIKKKILTETNQKQMNMEEAATIINSTIRGYLTRRLFKTERVTLLVQTIKDCLATALSLQNETNLGLSELDLQSRLLQQLTVACNDLHSTFSLPVDKKMAIIAADREKKYRLSLKKKTPLPLSEATRRTLQRKFSVNSAPPGPRKYERKRCKSASSTASETTSCRSTPGSRRRLATTILSQKYSVSLGGRQPWR